jgi:hypothetical protein
MQPPKEEPLPLPTEAQAEELRLVACEVCRVAESTEEEEVMREAKGQNPLLG